MFKYIIFCFIFFSVTPAIWGQERAVYNINKYNGLSSNHVYSTLVDKHGYLWIGTTDGVFRYNGYTFRKYDYNDGLSNVDIWNMQEDSKGRIWLKTISGQFGYILNNVYKAVHIDTSGVISEVYPSRLFELGDSVVFLNKIVTTSNHFNACIVRNDTLYSKAIQNYPVDVYTHSCQITEKDIIELSGGKIVLYSTKNWLSTPDDMHLPIVDTILEAEFDIEGFASYSKMVEIFPDKYLILNNIGDTAINIFNYKLNRRSRIPLLQNNRLTYEKLTHLYPFKNNLYAITNNSIFIIDSLLNINDVVDIKKVFQIQTKKDYANTYFVKDSIWGDILATNQSGLYINFRGVSRFQKASIALEHYKLTGMINDSEAYWWENETNTLAKVCNGRIVNKQHIGQVVKNHKIIPYTGQKSLMLNGTNTLWIYADGTTKDILQEIDSMVISNEKASYHLKEKSSHRYWVAYFSDCVIIDSAEIFYVGAGYNGINQLRLSKKANKAFVDSIYYDRFQGIVYNKLHDIIICYAPEKILVINKSTMQKLSIGFKQLSLINIKGIEKILVDDYGNVFIKDYSRLYVYNLHTRKMRQLFNNYQLEKALVSLSDNTLYLAGSFGVITCDVVGTNAISNINVYPNTKTMYYSYVLDAQFSLFNILLKTDRGFYSVNTRFSNDNKGHNNQYKIILDENNTLFNLYRNDTIAIGQTAKTLGVDIIRPTGTGNLNINYSINRGKYTNSGNQIILPNLSPGSYNIVSLIASDDSWNSNPTEFYIYIQPKWWQTSAAKKIILVLALVFFSGFIYMIVVLTRRIVNRTNERRNQRRELELKSIYSQINPHFIFNSLSTAQYFVKKNRNKEAYEHINQFSDLLRSYIKSSRNKYISIAEEIDNLQNYLQLQLTRFEEKFDYIITVDKSVDAEATKIPSLLLQPIVENALNHGIFHSHGKGLLSISFSIDRDNKNILICTVDDNGVGRKKSKELRSNNIRKADSYGTILIKELIDAFNKYEKIEINIEYMDKVEPETGTTVIIKIKK